jgi:hypothetical protein
MRGIAGIVVVLLLSLFIYKYYFTAGLLAVGPAGPRQMIDVIGVKNDLVSIAQAERIYQAQHNAYGSLDDLVSSGAMAIKKSGREGYTYDADSATDSFRIVARCTSPALPGCTNFAIDQTMEIQSTQ